MKHRFLNAVVLCLTAQAGSSAQTAPTTPLATPATTPAAPPAASKPLNEKVAADLLKSLNDLANQLDTAKGRKNGEALRAFQEAMTSDDKAFTLFADCKKQVDFEDKGQTGSEYGDWKRGDGKNWHEPDACAMLKLQLRWLVLTIEAANARTETTFGQVVSQVPSYLEAMLTDWKRLGGRFRGELRNDVLSSVYAKNFKLDQTIERLQGWEYSAGNVDGIYDAILLPYLRQKRSLQGIQTAWQNRIRQQSEMVEVAERNARKDENASGNGRGPDPRRATQAANRAEEEVVKFKEEKLPRLQWNALKDVYLLGNEEFAGPQLLSHLRSNLGHKDADHWILELAKLLKHEPLDPPPPPPSAKSGGRTPILAPAPTPPATPAPEAENKIEALQEPPVPK